MGFEGALSEGAFVLPSPGELGAFVCTQCGSTHLGLIPSPDSEKIIRLMCTICFNHLDFTVVGEEVRAPAGER